MVINATILDFYKFNFILGIKRMMSKEGLSRIINGIEYFRCLEDPLAFNNLKLERRLKLLDIGSSNTIFPLFVCSKGLKVWATDVDDCVLRLRYDAEKLRITDFTTEIQDARNMSYPDNYFDRISALSTLEHIPNDGDTMAIKEMSRVLKSGGVMAITIPYGSFEEKRQRYVSYFQRVYDKEDIYERLIKPSRLNVMKIEYFGEVRYNFTKYLEMIPSLFRFTFLWAQPIFSKLFLKKIDENCIDELSPPERDIFRKTGGVCLTLEKHERVVE